MSATSAQPRAELLDRAIAWFAENGVGDTSMRTLAAALGTSGRMLHYHFGSRDDLLRAVVESVESRERDVLRELIADAPDVIAAGERFWPHVADVAATFAPLFFELSAQAMHGRPAAERLRSWLEEAWYDEFAALYRRAGATPARARRLSRLSLATARGLLFDVAVTGDRRAADRAMDDFVAMVRTSLGA